MSSLYLLFNCDGWICEQEVDSHDITGQRPEISWMCPCWTSSWNSGRRIMAGQGRAWIRAQGTDGGGKRICACAIEVRSLRDGNHGGAEAIFPPNLLTFKNCSNYQYDNKVSLYAACQYQLYHIHTVPPSLYYYCSDCIAKSINKRELQKKEVVTREMILIFTVGTTTC